MRGGHTFKSLQGSITLCVGTYNDGIIEPMGVFSGRGKCFQSLRGIYFSSTMIEELLYADLVPNLNVIKWERTLGVLHLNAHYCVA